MTTEDKTTRPYYGSRSTCPACGGREMSGVVMICLADIKTEKTLWVCHICGHRWNEVGPSKYATSTD